MRWSDPKRLLTCSLFLSSGLRAYAKSAHDPPDSALGLQDYAVNFSVDTGSNDEASIFHVIRGLFGGYPGRYRLSPFYLMTNQYVNRDSRDLWYLKVPLTAPQLDRLQHKAKAWLIYTTPVLLEADSESASTGVKAAEALASVGLRVSVFISPDDGLRAPVIQKGNHYGSQISWLRNF